MISILKMPKACSSRVKIKKFPTISCNITQQNRQKSSRGNEVFWSLNNYYYFNIFVQFFKRMMDFKNFFDEFNTWLSINPQHKKREMGKNLSQLTIKGYVSSMRTVGVQWNFFYFWWFHKKKKKMMFHFYHALKMKYPTVWDVIGNILDVDNMNR